MITLIIYLIILSLVFINQRKLMYFPGQMTAEQIQEKLVHSNLQAWPSSSQYLGIIQQPPSPNAKATIIIFHGNAGTALDRQYYFDGLVNLGYRVILAEYPGYGGRAGKISEQTLISDGINLVKSAADQFQEPIYLWGESLGTGVVSGIAQAKGELVQGIILLTPFDSMARAAQSHYWYFFAGLLVKDRFNNVQNLKNFTGNVAVIVCTEDDVIPKQRGLRLYKLLSSNKRLWKFEKANHNQWPRSPTLSWWQEVMTFIHSHN